MAAGPSGSRAMSPGELSREEESPLSRRSEGELTGSEEVVHLRQAPARETGRSAGGIIPVQPGMSNFTLLTAGEASNSVEAGRDGGEDGQTGLALGLVGTRDAATGHRHWSRYCNRDGEQPNGLPGGH